MVCGDELRCRDDTRLYSINAGSFLRCIHMSVSHYANTMMLKGMWTSDDMAKIACIVIYHYIVEIHSLSRISLFLSLDV